MIIAKPKFSTLMSLGSFLIIAYGLSIWSVLSLPNEGPVPTWRYLLSGVILLIALLVTIKVVGGYRVLKLDADRWQVSYLLRSEKKRFKTTDINWWKVTTIKTKGGKYEELHVLSESGINVKLSPQEHTEYQKVLNYVQKKCPKKRVKTD